MKTTIIILLIALLILSGCRAVEETVEELKSCVSNCDSVCDLVKKNNLNLNGFNQIGLKKETGGKEVYCECACLE